MRQTLIPEKSYPAVSGKPAKIRYGGTSPVCDAESIPQGSGKVPRGYAAKA